MIGPCKLDGSPLLRSREWRLQFWNASIMDTWDLGPQLRGSPALPSKLKMTHGMFWGIPQGPDLQSRPTKQATFFEVKPRAAPFSAGRDFSRACKEQEVQGLWN